MSRLSVSDPMHPAAVRSVNNSEDWLAEFPYESKSLDMGSHAYRYVDEGSGDQPILAVHGNPTWSFYWRRLIGEFRSTHRVIAVDHLGCGRSDKPQDYPYSLSQHRDNLVELIDRLDLSNITLVVHDWGGAIGLSAAIERPERFRRLVITNTGAFPPPYVPKRISACRIPFLGTFAVRGLNGFARAATTMATERYRRLPGPAANGLLAPYDSWANRVAIDAFVKDIPMRASHRTHAVLESLENSLVSLEKIPKLLIWGMRDWCFRPECLRRFQKHWPNAAVLELANVGHYVMEDAPEEVIKALRGFLA